MASKFEDVGVPVSLPFTLSLVGLIVAAIAFVAGVSTASVFSEFLLTVGAGGGLAIAFAYSLISLFDSPKPAMIVRTRKISLMKAAPKNYPPGSKHDKHDAKVQAMVLSLGLGRGVGGANHQSFKKQQPRNSPADASNRQTILLKETMI